PGLLFWKMLISAATLGVTPVYASDPPLPPTAVFDKLWITNVVPSAPPPVTSEYLNEALNAPFPVPKLARLNGVANHAALPWLPRLGVMVSTSPAIVALPVPTRF